MAQGTRVLLVEDEPAHAELVQRAFARAPGPFHLTTSSSVASARTVLAAGEADVVITDWRLPDGNGLDLLRDGDPGRDVPVILMTSHGSEKVAIEALHAGAADYVVKSVESLSDMPHILERVLGAWRQRLERIRMQAALEASERNYRFLADHGVDVIWMMDLSLRLTWVSPSVLGMYGWTPDEMLALPVTEYVTAESLELVRRTLDGFLSGSAPLEATVEFEQRRKDGTTFWTEVKARLVPADGNSPDRIVGSTRDITERRQLEHQLAHAQKMEAIGVLAGGVAHDFNNLLTAILGHASLAELHAPPDSELRKDVEQILTAVERAAVLTKGLLSFSRKQAVVTDLLDVNEVIGAFHALLARIIGEDIELRVSCHDGRLPVRLGKGQFEQILMNLVTNARDAMPGGGTLTIASGRAEQDERLRGGPFASIQVTDTGTGIAPDAVRRVFEPFFTTKEAGKGTGLGLAIVYGIVTRHGGRIDVDSQPGRGTTFTVRLPLSSERFETARRPVSTLPAGRGETILVAEDDSLARPMVRRLLEQFGYVVVDVPDGEAAVQAFTQHGDRIQLVLCDVIMPRRNGRETCDAIRALKADMKILFMSGYTGDVLAQKAVLQPDVEVLSKPLDTAELLQTIRRLLDAAVSDPRP